MSTGARWDVLYTAPHAEFAPFQRVWNPDTNNDYSVQDFSDDEGDEDSGIVTDDVAGDDGKFKDVEVPAFNGEDYFDAKPIGCVKNLIRYRPRHNLINGSNLEPCAWLTCLQ
jgi:hypothetical protein